jgi:hypothetical protein
MSTKATIKRKCVLGVLSAWMISLGAISHSQTRDLSLLHVNLNSQPQPVSVDEAIWLQTAGSVPSGMHVRVFFASKKELKTNKPGSDGCISLTGRLLSRELASGTIKVDPVSTAGTIVSTVVTLVFELGDSPSTDTIRLANRAEMGKYIDSGVEVTLLQKRPSNQVAATPGDIAPGAAAGGVRHRGAAHSRSVAYSRSGGHLHSVVLEPSESTQDCYDVKSLFEAKAPDPKPDSAVTVVALMEPFGCGHKPTLSSYNPTPAGF